MKYAVAFWFLVITVFTMTLKLLGLLRHIVCYLHVRIQSWARMPFFSQRYGRSLDELFLENVHLSTHVINNYCYEQILEHRMSTALFLHECVLLRDGILSFSNISMTKDDICHIITELCTV